jgi:hypothetical protein
MRYSLLLAGGLAAGILLIPCLAVAGPLDGAYVSNKRNNLTILGNHYAYRARKGGKSGNHAGSFVAVGGDQYQFHGFLRYLCDKRGTTLVCAGGKRSWYKQ